MTIVEMRPGICLLNLTPEPYGPHIPPMDLSDPMQEADVMRECRQYVLAVHSKCYEHVADSDLDKAIRIASSVCTILQSLAIGRAARDAAAVALRIDAACKAAIDEAERL